MNLAKSMKVAMAMRGLNQGQLAALTGIHSTNLSKMMNGKYGIHDENLSKIAEAVNMKVSDFVKLGED